MPNNRQNVWELGDPWASPILWYARGVAAMKARALAAPTSWRFYAAIHGFDPVRWQQVSYFDPAEPMPSQDLQDTYWKQCQHGTWYFLPWHRGYVLAFEKVIRAEVVNLQGPSDWTIPYWNYFKQDQAALPPAFASPDWPDGQGNNPLFVPQRYGPNSDGNVFVPLDQVNLNAMTDPDFTGVASGGSTGFGGIDTGFSHGGQVHGGIETQPHDWVHGLVGGENTANPPLPGLMSVPDIAALDPVFWLHHANIDRLWEVWRQNPPSDTDPTDANWLGGPANIGERVFALPMPDGSKYTYTPADMVDLTTLGYTYDDLSPAVPTPSPLSRLLALGRKPETMKDRGGVVVETGKNVELVGASKEAVPIEGADIAASVQLDHLARRKLTASLNMDVAKPQPDRVFLNLENVRGLSDATAFNIYVGVPKGANPADHPELLAGSIALFGVGKASNPDDEHGGQGLTFVLEITKLADRLHLDKALDVDALHLRIVPIRPVSKDARVSIGRISIYRQGH